MTDDVGRFRGTLNFVERDARKSGFENLPPIVRNEEAPEAATADTPEALWSINDRREFRPRQGEVVIANLAFS